MTNVRREDAAVSPPSVAAAREPLNADVLPLPLHVTALRALFGEIITRVGGANLGATPPLPPKRDVVLYCEARLPDLFKRSSDAVRATAAFALDYAIDLAEEGGNDPGATHWPLDPAWVARLADDTTFSLLDTLWGEYEVSIPGGAEFLDAESRRRVLEAESIQGGELEPGVPHARSDWAQDPDTGEIAQYGILRRGGRVTIGRRVQGQTEFAEITTYRAADLLRIARLMEWMMRRSG